MKVNLLVVGSLLLVVRDLLLKLLAQLLDLGLLLNGKF
jgi:hypothetical protein